MVVHKDQSQATITGGYQKKTREVPVIDKPNYWNYVGCYNNFIAKSKIKIKLPGYQKAVLLRNPIQ